VLAGEGVAFAESRRFALKPGSCVAFPPGVEHGIDNVADPEAGVAGGGQRRLCVLQLMTPNEGFVQWVTSGEEFDSLGAEDLCELRVLAC